MASESAVPENSDADEDVADKGEENEQDEYDGQQGSPDNVGHHEQMVVLVYVSSCPFITIVCAGESFCNEQR